MRDALLTAAGAAAVALLNELRASLRARQADRDRRERYAWALAQGRRTHVRLGVRPLCERVFRVVSRPRS